MGETNAEDGHGSLSRRSLLSATASIGGAVLMPAIASGHNSPPPSEHAAHQSPRCISLTVNGDAHRLTVEAMTTLADALREHIGLTGTKIGCNHGQCGACTVHVGGRRVLSCLTLAVMCEGKPVTTTEGLAAGDRLHPMQQAFIDHDAFQCGYCTPGQIMSAVALVREGHSASDDDIREYMSGNLCRCAAYPKIVAAVRDGARRMEG